MALSSATVWEIRPGSGSSNNSGGFVAGASGTDFSQQNAAQYNATDLAGTSANTAAPVVTSASHNFVAADVGNIIHITAGTNWTAGFYQIVSCAANAATLDRACASVASPTAGTYFVGGAMASVANISSVMVAGNTVYSKGGSTDTLGATLTITAGTITAPVTWEGYISTRGDIRTATWANTHTADGFLDVSSLGTWPLIAVGTQTITANSMIYVIGLRFTTTRTTTQAVNVSSNGYIFRCQFSGTGAGTALCLATGTRSIVDDCDFSNTSATGGFALSGSGIVKGCRFTSTNGGGITCVGGMDVFNCVFYAMAASQTAIAQTTANVQLIVVNNTFDGIAGICISSPDVAQTSPLNYFANNQVTNCGTFASNLRTATQSIMFFSTKNRIRDTSTSYTGWLNNTVGMGDITSAQTDANEYVNKAAANFRLKDGAAGQMAAFPLYLDTGAWQRQEPTLPTVGNVRNGVGFGDGGTEFTGTVVVPSSNDVRNGTSFDTSSTGNLVSPAVGNVRSGITFGSSSSLTGTLIVPAVGDVRLGTSFDTASTGTLRVPSTNDVRNGTAFDVSSTGNLVVPSTSNVRNGITFGSSSGLTGVLVLPLQTDVLSGVNYGANGSEFTGTASGGTGGGFILGG